MQCQNQIFSPRGDGGDELGVCDIDEAVSVGAVLEEVPVEAILLHGPGVQGVDLLPVLGSRGPLVEEVRERRLLALGGHELVEGHAGEEEGDGGDGAFLRAIGQWADDDGDDEQEEAGLTPNDSLTWAGAWWE